MKKTYYVWQMKQECFEKLTLRAYGMNQESSEAKESSCVDLSDYDLTCVVVREGDILENLEQLYRELNEETRLTRHFTHSLSIGDMIEVRGNYYRVAMMGFEEVQVASTNRGRI